MSMQSISIWLIALATISIVLLSIEVGYRLGKNIQRRTNLEKESPVAVISGAILGLLAFMLAFTFGILYNRFDARKELVRSEANAIGTAWLRADFMSEPDRGKSVQLLKEYTSLRLEAARAADIATVQKVLVTSEKIQRKLWDLAVVNSRKDMNSDVAALYIESLNEVINLHGLRMARAYQAKTPIGLWISLYTLLLFSMFSIGFQTAIAGSSRTLATVILAISFTVVFVLIASLDQLKNGFFKVSQQPLVNVQLFMAGDTQSEVEIIEEP
jgi:hypothetical protein